MTEDDVFQSPVFVFTSDQDWSPAWAAEALLSELEKYAVKAHFFRTNPCSALDQAFADRRITQGWHPNFLPASSHGSDIESVLDHMRETFPGCNTVRTHCFVENTFIWGALAKAGILADSQMPTLYQARLFPIQHWTGIVRFPIFFEDDLFVHDGGDLSLSDVLKNLFSPGLKILNFHATFVATNAPSRAYYDARKETIFRTGTTRDEVAWSQRGALTIMRELMEAILCAGHQFVSFTDLVEQTVGTLHV